MADLRGEGFIYGLKGLKKGAEGIKKGIDWFRSLGKEAEKAKAVASKVKLAPRQRLQVKMQQAAKEPTAEEIAQMQHQQRVNARISKNAGGNKGLEHNLRLKQKYAEQKFGKEFQDKLIREHNFTPEGAASITRESQLNMFNKYLKSSGRTPVNLTRAEAEAINKEVESTLRKDRIQNIENVRKLAERYNRMYPELSNKRAAYIASGIAGGIGGIGVVGGTIYNALTSGVPEQSKQPQSKYRYTSNNGWQKLNQETGQYENQQQGFGIDRYGNTNYYDGTNWLTPDQYVQGSNGYIYDNQTGQIIGMADDTMEARSNGYDNVFDYRAAKAGYNNPEDIKQLQKELGINADGKWGKQTQDAFDRAIKNWAYQYDPNSLFSIYQRKTQFGY